MSWQGTGGPEEDPNNTERWSTGRERQEEGRVFIFNELPLPLPALPLPLHTLPSLPLPAPPLSTTPPSSPASADIPL